jgi:non-heme chloroperoxidase
MFNQRLLKFFAVVFILVSVLACTSREKEGRDLSQHRVQFVTVEEGVELEVLEWGSSGKAIVLLAGLGNTAHVFDALAPIIAKKHHVYGITRRGFGASSSPASGYTLPRLAEDVMIVIRALNLDKPMIAGHSMAGEEMHLLGAQFHEEISALVYIDAAFNRLDGSPDYDEISAKLPRSPSPAKEDLKSLSAMKSFLVKLDIPILPDDEYRNKYNVNPDGSIGGERMPAPQVVKGMMGMMRQLQEAYNPKPILVPALSIYAAPAVVDDLVRPWYEMNDPEVKKNVEDLYASARNRVMRHEHWFQDLAKNSEVVEIASNHMLFLTHAVEVVNEIEKFLSTIPR